MEKSTEIKFRGSEFTSSFHPTSGQFEVAAAAETAETLATCRLDPCHPPGEVLPSFVSAVSGWPSVLLPLSEAAEHLSDTSTCQQAPDTSSADARDSFLQPAPDANALFPPPKF